MAWNPININAPLFTNVKGVSQGTVTGYRRDVLKDASGSTYQRPSLVEFAEMPVTSGDGNFYWSNKNLFLSVFGGNLYTVDIGGNVSAVLGGTGLFAIGTPTMFRESSRPTSKIFMSNGGRIIEFDGSTASVLTDGDAPKQVTHIGILDTYLIANNLAQPERMEYSEVAAPTSWVGEYVSAEGAPDKLRAIHVGWREIVLFGETSIEFWYDDGVNPFSRIEGAMIQSGTMAPYSVVQADNSWFYLDSNRRVVQLLGRQPKSISHPVNDIFAEITDVSDAVGEHITQDGVALYLLRVGERCLVYDYALQEWVSDWGRFNESSQLYDRFRGQHFVDVAPWNFTICSDYKTNMLYKLDFDTSSDDGDILRPSWTTGNIDHGSGLEKRSDELKIRLRRGAGTPGSTEPIMYVRWQDNGQQVWSNYREIPLGLEGDSDMFRSIYILGSYRTRKYEFSVTDNIPITLVSVEEDVKMMNR